MGVSVQALRHYGKIGLLKPSYVNHETGYRYYTADQFHVIDRIRYLQNFGMSLSEISQVLSQGTTEGLVRALQKRKRETLRELRRIQQLADDIQWYQDYLTHLEDDPYPDIPYKQVMQNRYFLAVPCMPEDDSDSLHLRLSQLRSREEYRGLPYRRQFVYLLDFDSLMRRLIIPTHLGIALRSMTPPLPEHVLVRPAGEYLCFRGRLLTGEWDPSYVSKYFEHVKAPPVVFANSYEENLHDETRSMYEMQILIKPL